MSNTTVWQLDEEGNPLPRNGGYFAIYKPKGQKNFWANIVLPDGHKEKWDCHSSERFPAIGAAQTYVRVLCRQRGVPTKHEKRQKKGEPSPYQKTKLNNEARAAGLPLPYPRGHRDPRGGIVVPANGATNGATEKRKPGRPPGSGSKRKDAALVPIVASPTEDGQEWRGFIRRHEERCVVFFHRISELIIAEAHTDPLLFVQHIRAMIIESYENSFRKPRARPPGA